MLRVALFAFALTACKDKAPPDVKVAAPAKVPPSPCASAEACFELGKQLKADGDAAAAYAAHRRGCDQFPGAGANCFTAALFVDTQGAAVPAAIPPDPATAQSYYLKACEQGFADGCANAGVHQLQTGELPRGHELILRSCTMKSGFGCNNLGVTVRDGLGVAADRARAAKLFEQACTLEYGSGCHNLGLAYMKGDGVAIDRVRAAVLLDQACTLTPKHCFDIGLAYELGDGVAKDLAQARQRYDRGCTAGDLLSCNNLAGLQADGAGGAKDSAGSRKNYQRACDGGVQMACDNLRVPD